MIRPTKSAVTVNRFANHPDIRPLLGGVGEMDLSAGVVDPNVFLFGEHGGFCWIWTAPDTFEGHVMLTPQGRGKWGFAALRQSIEHMKGIGARHLWARIDPDRPEVGVFARHGGLRPWGTHRADAGSGPVDWQIYHWRDECPQQS